MTGGDRWDSPAFRKWCQGIADIAAEHARQMARGWRLKMDLWMIWMMDMWPYWWRLYFVDELKEPLAVCNEGFSYKASSIELLKRWHI